MTTVLRPSGRPSRGAHCAVAVLLAAWLVAAGANVAIAQTPPSSTGVIAEYLGRGDGAFRRGDFAAAREAWRDAARLCRVENQRDLESDAIARSAEASLALGLTKDAIAELRSAQAIAEAGADVALQAAVRGALGNALLIARLHQEAAGHLSASIEAARRIGDQATIAGSANNYGNLLSATGRLAEAAPYYEESSRAAASAGEGALQVVALRNLARLHGRAGDRRAKAVRLQEAAQAAAALEPSHNKVYSLVSIGTIAAAKDASAQEQRLAYVVFRDAVQTAETIGDRRGQSLAYGYLGRLYETGGRRDEAMVLTERALDLAQREKYPELLYRWDWQMARLLKAAGDDASALSAYTRAVRELQDIRRDIPIDYEDGRSSFRDTVGPLFLELADLLMRQAAGSKEAAATAAFLASARDTVEKIKAAEIQDYFKDQCVGASAGRAVKLQSVAARTAILYPIILPDRTEIIVSLPDGDTFVTAQIGEERLTQEIRLLRSALENPDSAAPAYLEPAKQIYDWLLAPVAPILKRNDIQSVVVVPDGALRLVPFAALHDGKRFLIESYAIASAPGLDLIDPSPLPRQGMAALVAGVSDGVQGFPPIPDVKVEVATLAERLSAKMMLNEGFTLATFEREIKARPFKVVHIASHGVFGSTAEDSFVLAYDTKLDMNRLESLFKLNYTHAEPVELLMLSACSTAAGDDRAPLGLAGVALKSGARSSIASLWAVSDQATAALSIDLYQRLQTSAASKSEALRQAQMGLIRSEQFGHPAFWAPFLLIGNWL